MSFALFVSMYTGVCLRDVCSCYWVVNVLLVCYIVCVLLRGVSYCVRFVVMVARLFCCISRCFGLVSLLVLVCMLLFGACVRVRCCGVVFFDVAMCVLLGVVLVVRVVRVVGVLLSAVVCGCLGLVVLFVIMRVCCCGDCGCVWSWRVVAIVVRLVFDVCGFVFMSMHCLLLVLCVMVVACTIGVFMQCVLRASLWLLLLFFLFVVNA